MQLIHQGLSYSHLLLGHDATIGRGKEGDPEHVRQIAQSLGFHVEYLPPQKIAGEIVSSTAIRESLQKGDLAHVEKLLGRPYSIYSSIIKNIDDRIINVDVSQLCLPPPGEYAAKATFGEMIYSAVAHLSVSGLEVRFFEPYEKKQNQFVEIIF